MATKNKESKFKKTKSKATPKPMSNNGATAPVAKARSGGSDGYRGYDYQILATVWLALDLMTSGKADVIIVAPPSQDASRCVPGCHCAISNGLFTAGGYGLYIGAASGAGGEMRAKD